jgi:serine/threonine-protein kinase
MKEAAELMNADVEIPIPDLISQNLNDELKAKLEEQNITLSVTEVNNDIYGQGQIVSQNPQGGQTRKIATKDHMVTVEVEVSLGKKSFVLSDYTGKEYRKAQIDLEGLGVKVNVDQKNDPNVIAGYIISTDPAAGTEVKSGDPITLIVSKGAETAYSKMIDVRGAEAGEAKRKLFAANFLVGDIKKQHSDTVPEGYVIDQSIEPGTSTAQRYTEVDLTISLGPKE